MFGSEFQQSNRPTHLLCKIIDKNQQCFSVLLEGSDRPFSCRSHKNTSVLVSSGNDSKSRGPFGIGLFYFLTLTTLDSAIKAALLLSISVQGEIFLQILGHMLLCQSVDINRTGQY